MHGHKKCSIVLKVVEVLVNALPGFHVDWMCGMDFKRSNVEMGAGKGEDGTLCPAVLRVCKWVV